jgi:hypothetical protein
MVNLIFFELENMSVVRMMNYDLTYVLEHYKRIAEFFIIWVTSNPNNNSQPSEFYSQHMMPLRGMTATVKRNSKGGDFSAHLLMQTSLIISIIVL